MVVFLSVGMIDALVEQLIKGGYPADTPVAVVERASWPEERIVRGRLSDIAVKVKDAAIMRTALIYLGAALEPADAAESKLYDKDFKHGYRP